MLKMPELLKMLADQHASDLYLKVARPPIFRIAGTLTASDLPKLSAEEVMNLVNSMMNQDQIKKFVENLDIDFSYSLPGVARFRVNAFRQRGVIGCIIRAVPYDIPTVDQLGLPPVLNVLCQKTQGLVLVTGPTGSGKSTTLAALVGYINKNRNCHIITIEDPIEFLHRDEKSTIDQRELEVDTKSFREALRRALRQDPDVLLIGEMRDMETISTALSAAETGHLVFSTLHTNDATQTIDRIIDIYPPAQQTQIRIQLSLILLGVVSQRLLKRKDGKGRISAVEVMINSPLIKDLIEKGNTSGLRKVIESSTTYWQMQSLNQAIARVVNVGLVNIEEALSATPYPDDLRLALKGGQAGGGIVIGGMGMGEY
ncbi:MAG: type IV pilus twitching motility protein PilT [bacterium]|nr:type IV pilus twitching motility protein PilT [bacterium]